MKRILTALCLLFSLTTLNAQFIAPNTYVHVIDQDQDTITLYFSPTEIFSTDYTPDMLIPQTIRTQVKVKYSYTQDVGGVTRYVYKTEYDHQDVYVYLGLYGFPTVIVTGPYTYRVIQDY